MADYTDVTDVAYAPTTHGTPHTPDQHGLASFALSVPTDPPLINQRIYDNGLAQWVYYSLLTSTATPDVGDTSPNHSGSLDAASHEVL